MLSGQAGQGLCGQETLAWQTILGFLMLHFGEFAGWCESESVAQAIVERLKRETDWNEEGRKRESYKGQD